MGRPPRSRRRGRVCRGQRGPDGVVFGIDVARRHDGPVEGADVAEMVGKLQFTAGEDTRRHHPSGGASGGERQAGRAQAGGGRGDSGGSRHRVGRSKPRPARRSRSRPRPPRWPRPQDRAPRRQLRRPVETTDRSTAVVTGQRDDGRAGEPGQHREPTGPVHPALGGCGPVLVTMRRGGPRWSCRGAGPPGGPPGRRRAAPRRPAPPAARPGPRPRPLPGPRSPRHRRWHAVAAGRRVQLGLGAVRPQGWPLRRGRRRWGRSRSRPGPEWPSGSSGARPATGIQAVSKVSRCWRSRQQSWSLAEGGVGGRCRT